MAEEITQPLDRHEQAHLGETLRERIGHHDDCGLPHKLETLMAALRDGDSGRARSAGER